MSAAVIPLKPRHDARRVQALARAMRHRDLAAALGEGSLRAVEVLAEHAVAAGGLDRAGAFGLHLAVTGARAAAAALAEARRAIEAVLSAEADHGAP